MVESALPLAGEGLAVYIKRLRKQQDWSVVFLAQKAGVHPQSLRKLEDTKSKQKRLNKKTRTGLARAFDIPETYLDAALKGLSVSEVQVLKYCPRCWEPGTPLEVEWGSNRAVFCFSCGEKLSSVCLDCGEPFLSASHRFCPFCGGYYKNSDD